MGTRLKQYKCLNARVTCEKGAFSEWGVTGLVPHLGKRNWVGISKKKTQGKSIEWWLAGQARRKQKVILCRDSGIEFCRTENTTWKWEEKYWQAFDKLDERS